MSNSSNLYAEKVFGEHPLALWSLDEQLDYISLVADGADDFSNPAYWSLTGCTANESNDLLQQISGKAVYEIDSISGSSFEILGDRLVSDYINPNLGSVNIALHFYASSTNIESVTVGYKYDSVGVPRYTDDAEHSVTFPISTVDEWTHFSETFELPPEEFLTINSVDNELLIDEGNPTVVAIAGHGFVDGDRLKISSDFDMPPAFNKYSTYYVVNATEDTFEITSSVGGVGLQFSYPQYGNLYLILVKTISPFIRYQLLDSNASKSYINGFSIGQWSEEFSNYSSGVSVVPVSGINIDDEYYGIEAKSYGLNDITAYYLARENRLLAQNKAMPMVYGSSSVTCLYPERFGGPSLIFPGNGFLNESGRYKTFTVEMWLRISPDIKEQKRIFGPIASSDGIYVDGPFLTLKIGESIAAHYVGEWYRPMLVNLIVFRNGASMTINGEKVIDLSFSTDDLELPGKTNLAGKDQDWVGFYSYDDIFQFEVDCFGIYSYRVPTAVAKRRWVYGQAVDFPENIAASYSGKSFPIDYTFAKYSNNYIYPDIARWRQGISENISSNNNVLQPPAYALPEIVFNNKTADSWISGLSRNLSDAITLKPDASWVDTDGYLFFEKANVLEQKTVGFYSVFEAPIGYNSTETLFRLQNQITGNYIDVELHTINKEISDVATQTITSYDHGLNTNDIISFSGSVAPEILPGKDYYVEKLNNDQFYIKDSLDGSPILLDTIPLVSAKFIAHVIRYKLRFNSSEESLIYQTPAIALGTSFVAGLDFTKFANTFGGNVSTIIGNKRQLRLYIGGNKDFNKTFSGSIYRVGFCTQRNLDKLSYLFDSNGIPFLRYQFDGGTDSTYDNNEYVGETVDAGFTYEEYIDDIMSHIASYTLLVRNFFGQRYLDIATSSYWQDYVPLTYFAKNVSDISGKTKYSVDFIQFNSDTIVPAKFDDGDYDTNDSMIRTYVSFQLIESGPTKTGDYFSVTKPLPRSRTVEPGSDWLTTRYEVVNGSLIYPPPDVDINDIAMVVHVEMSSKGIIKNPIRIRSLQLAGKSLNALMSNPIQTKLGVSIYPYKKYGVYYDYDAKNPYLIYKDSTPHLYLTKHSGLELTGDFSESNRGFSLPINKEKRSEYDLSAVQFSARFTRDDVVADATEIIHIENGDADYLTKIFIEPILPSGKRFRLFATDKYGQELTDVLFYINGSLSTLPVISINDWNTISIAFTNSVDMDGKSGRINFVGPIMFNNVSYFALNASQNAMLESGNANGYIGVDPAELYGILTGTNKLIFGDSIGLSPKGYQYSFINGVNVQSATIKPV